LDQGEGRKNGVQQELLSTGNNKRLLILRLVTALNFLTITKTTWNSSLDYVARPIPLPLVPSFAQSVQQ
jgi:hypothetical protein